VSWSALWPDTSPLRGPGAGAFRAVFLSRTVVYLGSQAAEVALLVQAKQLTGSPLVVGTLGLAELVPLVVFGLYGGVLADRFDRRALMRWCEPGLALCGVLLLLNALLPHPLLWPLYVVAALMMAFASLQRPAFEAATPRIVPRAQLTAAAAILSLSTNASVLLGSSLGGVLAVAPGPWLVYALDAVGFVVSFFLLSWGVPELPAGAVAGECGDGHDQSVSNGPLLREILIGLRYAVGRKDLLGSYLADLSAMVFAYPNAMLPFLAVELHAPWSTGLMFAAPSAGAFAVSATSGWMPRVRRHGLAIAIAAASWGLAMGMVGLAPSVWVALAFLAVAGGADECSGVFRDAMWKQSIPDHLRGRMAGIELLSYAAGPPAGQLRSGAVAAVTGPRFSLTSGGLACVAAVGAVVVALPAFRHYLGPPAGASSSDDAVSADDVVLADDVSSADDASLGGPSSGGPSSGDASSGGASSGGVDSNATLAS
jgi:MFS family permease